MMSQPKRAEVSEYTIRLIVGIIALFLATATSFLSGADPEPIRSISASYFEGDWPRNVFVGSLFAIASFLFAYNGDTSSSTEFFLSKLAAISAIGIAVFPCQCTEYIGSECVNIEPSSFSIHGAFAGTLFVILAVFCYRFYKRAKDKIDQHPAARWRALIYAISGLVMLASMLAVFLNHVEIIDGGPRIVFICEAAALAAFGVAWLTASRILPIITDPDERNTFSPFK